MDGLEQKALEWAQSGIAEMPAEIARYAEYCVFCHQVFALIFLMLFIGSTILFEILRRNDLHTEQPVIMPIVFWIISISGTSFNVYYIYLVSYWPEIYFRIWSSNV
jgi:hypothetical protein